MDFSKKVYGGLFAPAMALAFTLGMPASAAADIVFATEGDYPPWNQHQPDGKFAGFDIDLVSALCTSLGESCQIVTDTFPAMIDAVAEEAFDAIISGIAITAEREEKIAFTRPYMSYAASFAARSGSALAADATAANADLLNGLAGARIGAQAATVNAQLVESLVPDATLVTFGDQGALNRALAGGDIDAALAGTQTWKDPASAAPDAIVVIGSPFTSADYPLLGQGLGIGVAKGNDKLKASLDGAVCT